MSDLLNKSQLTINSAKRLKELVEQPEHTVSVHSFYYGTFQYMLYKLSKTIHKSYEQLEADRLDYNRNRNIRFDKFLGSHDYVINQVRQIFFNKNKKAWKEFQNNIIYLKELRIRADYTPERLNQTESSKAENYTQRIIERLTTL